ncbi:hypothetical protein CP97_04275 [Aurantiacibacter atlanticus]|uniref:Uncharacterized protein n=2 Tax=Aurantiacibacter atlanticus TaxID=1648404 RepID=A0A0H4VF05_9SPHN|nr:hypothetical protein CP97_04275 [Aurantiacibacter atlanticus]
MGGPILALQAILLRISAIKDWSMALGNPQGKKAPLGVFVMLIALVVAAFLGAAAGLIWQGSDWFSEEPEEEVLTKRAQPV